MNLTGNSDISGMSTLRNGCMALVTGTLAARAGGCPPLKRWAQPIVGSAFVAPGSRLALSKS